MYACTYIYIYVKMPTHTRRTHTLSLSLPEDESLSFLLHVLPRLSLAHSLLNLSLPQDGEHLGDLANQTEEQDRRDFTRTHQYCLLSSTKWQESYDGDDDQDSGDPTLPFSSAF